MLKADGKVLSDNNMVFYGNWKFQALGNTGSWQSIGEIERVLPNFI